VRNSALPGGAILASMKEKQIQAAQLLAAGESRSAVARQLGISRRVLLYWLKREDFQEGVRTPAYPAEWAAAVEHSKPGRILCQEVSIGFFLSLSLPSQRMKTGSVFAATTRITSSVNVSHPLRRCEPGSPSRAVNTRPLCALGHSTLGFRDHLGT
jgi:Homeodomain-like domain-containing protein